MFFVLKWHISSPMWINERKIKVRAGGALAQLLATQIIVKQLCADSNCMQPVKQKVLMQQTGLGSVAIEIINVNLPVIVLHSKRVDRIFILAGLSYCTLFLAPSTAEVVTDNLVWLFMFHSRFKEGTYMSGLK